MLRATGTPFVTQTALTVTAAANNIALIGDSITLRNFNIANALGFGADGYFTMANMLMGSPFNINYVGAQTGYTIEQIASSFLSGAVSSGSQYCFVLAGTNNAAAGSPDSGATILAKLVSYLWGPLWNSGIKVIASTLMPRGDISGNQIQSLEYANDLIRIAGKTYPNLIVCDLYRYFVSYATSVPRTGFTADNIHPNYTGALYLGREIYNCLSSLTSSPPVKTGSYSNGSPLVMSSNPLAYGANASGTNKWAVAGSASGTGPHAWGATTTGTGSAVCTGGQTRLDQSDGQALQVACSFTANGDSVEVLAAISGSDVYISRNWAGTTAKGLGELVNPSTGNNGYLYKSLSVGGSTGSGEPTWPTTVGQTVVDGTVTWLCCPNVNAGTKLVFEVDVAVTAISGQFGIRTSIQFQDSGYSGTLRPTGYVGNTLYTAPDSYVYGSYMSAFTNLWDSTFPINKIVTIRTPVGVVPANTVHLAPMIRIFGTAGSSCTILVHRAEMKIVQ